MSGYDTSIGNNSTPVNADYHLNKRSSNTSEGAASLNIGALLLNMQQVAFCKDPDISKVSIWDKKAAAGLD